MFMQTSEIKIGRQTIFAIITFLKTYSSNRQLSWSWFEPQIHSATRVCYKTLSVKLEVTAAQIPQCIW